MKYEMKKSSIIFLFLLIIFCFLTEEVKAQETEIHEVTVDDNQSFVDFKFVSWGNWIFRSYLQDQTSDATSYGIELTSLLDVGNIEIKNISYFEINRYPRAIPGQPIGNPYPEVEGADGIGDLLSGFWFSKREHHHRIHHFAPGFALQLPMASDPSLGSGKWAVGPSFDYDYENKNLIAGAIFIQLWSFAGDEDRKEVNMMLIKPFLFYNFAKKWDLMYVPYGVSIYWNKEKGQRVYFPLGGGIRRSFSLGTFADLNLSAQFFHNVLRPDKGTVNDLRFLIEFAF